MVWKTILILLAAVYTVASLECYSCKGVLDLSACNSTQRCSDGEACFHNSTASGQSKVSSLGCIDYQQCGAHGNVQSSIVGRDILAGQTSSCFECCSTDQCNTNLCAHLKPTTCIDDESIDCAKMNTLFNICLDINHAKKVCPKFCGLCNVVDGNWSTWSSWSECDVTCENGTQSRSRSCTNPAPQHGGLDCQGRRSDIKSCVKELCPVHGGWSSWERWALCSRSCGTGLQNRVRNCSNPIPIRNGNPCFGHSFDVRQCMLRPCQDGGWSDWSTWSSCSVSCDVGVRTQSRSCTNPRPSPFGRNCQGDNIKIETCSRNDCVHGGWSSWEHWTACSRSCGTGLQHRVRNCSNPISIRNGNHCFGNSSDVRQCMLRPCQVNGVWSSWERWTACSRSCGTGLQHRVRNCSNPISVRNGNPCFGNSSDVRQCMLRPCQDGVWSDWSTWSSCSVTCDVGVRTQSRSCTNPGPSPFGRNCQGNNIKVETCSRNDCIVGSDCYDVTRNGLGNVSGIYHVKVQSSLKELDVYCDLETSGGGWTVFQHRFDGSLDFYQNFLSYTQGFGSLDGEFWLGLEHIYEMVSHGQSELRIDLTAADGTTAYEVFPNFSLSPGPAYTLHIGQGSGTAGDGLGGLSYHNNQLFSTYDHGKTSCAYEDRGGWWYKNCAYANLNGKYIKPGSVPLGRSKESGMTYNDFEGYRSLKATKLMFRRI